VSAIAGRVPRFSYRNLAISTVETSTPVGCRGAAPRRDAEGGEQNQNDGGRGWFVKFLFNQQEPNLSLTQQTHTLAAQRTQRKR